MHATRKIALALGVAVALLAPAPASADHAGRDLCAGVVETDGCWYCAGTVNPAALPTDCHDGAPGHEWAQCELWVAATCVLGSVRP